MGATGQRQEDSELHKGLVKVMKHFGCVRNSYHGSCCPRRYLTSLDSCLACGPDRLFMCLSDCGASCVKMISEDDYSGGKVAPVVEGRNKSRRKHNVLQTTAGSQSCQSGKHDISSAMHQDTPQLQADVTTLQHDVAAL